MPAGTAAIFVTTPRAPAVRIATANTARDGTGTVGTLFTAGPNGAFFKGFRYQAEGNTTAGVVRLFIQAAGAGNNELKREMLVSNLTPGTGTEAASGEWYPPAGIMLGAGDVVKVSTHNAEAFSCWLEAGGDY
jgi:hypothetical protein